VVVTTFDSNLFSVLKEIFVIDDLLGLILAALSLDVSPVLMVAVVIVTL
ncbi:33760_t:CDS:1, partial [Gigaspora margarita]